MHVVGSIPQTVSTMRSSLGLVATDAVRLNAYSLAKRRPQAENTHPVTAERGGTWVQKWGKGNLSPKFGDKLRTISISDLRG